MTQEQSESLKKLISRYKKAKTNKEIGGFHMDGINEAQDVKQFLEKHKKELFNDCNESYYFVDRWPGKKYLKENKMKVYVPNGETGLKEFNNEEDAIIFMLSKIKEDKK